jgi:hypothetical protein
MPWFGRSQINIERPRRLRFTINPGIRKKQFFKPAPIGGAIWVDVGRGAARLGCIPDEIAARQSGTGQSPRAVAELKLTGDASPDHCAPIASCGKGSLPCASGELGIVSLFVLYYLFSRNYFLLII